MAHQNMNYDESFPKKKINKTIIFTNSAKRKLNIKNAPAAVTNHRSNASKQKEPQSSHADCAEPSTSKQILHQRSPFKNTLMDSRNPSKNTVSPIPTAPPNSNANDDASSTFCFNFGSGMVGSRNKPRKRRKPRVPNKENGTPHTAQSNFLKTKEFNDRSSHYNTTAGSVPATSSKDELSVPNGSNTAEKTPRNVEPKEFNDRSFGSNAIDGTVIGTPFEFDLNVPNGANVSDRQPPKVPRKFNQVNMNTIYPDELEGILPPFGIQHRLRNEWYCLICDVNAFTFRNLKQHAESERHGNASEARRMKLNSYIDFWTAQPEDCKKYQISFNICKGKEMILQCSQCWTNIKENKYMDHMLLCKEMKPKPYTKMKKYKDVKENIKVKISNESQNCAVLQIDSDSTPINVNEQTSGSPQKSKEGKKKVAPKLSHDVRCHTISTRWCQIIEGVSSRLDRHYKFFQKHRKGALLCMECEMEIEYDIVQILVHLASKEHHRMSGLFKTFWTFKCGICDRELKSESEFWCHRNLDDAHKEKIEQLPEIRHQSLGEFECRGCKLVMFGDAVNIDTHIQSPPMKRPVKQVDEIPTALEQATLDLFKTHTEIEFTALNLLSEVKEVEALDYQVTEIIADLEDTLRKSFPEVKAYPFGSRITGICNKSSDLDVYVDIQSNYYGEKAMQRTEIIQQMKRPLVDRKQLWDDIFTIAAARTPIIQLRHIPTKMDIDLSFQNGLSVENTKFIRFCMDLQPKLRPLMLLLKLWNSNIKTNVTPYALCMLAIFKMQIDGHLIPVSYLRHLQKAATEDEDLPLRSNEKFVTGWNIIDYRLSADEVQKYIVPIKSDVFDLLKSFFEYYAAFDYNKLICPLMGEVINMDDWYEDNVSILPDEMDVYKEKVYNGLLQHIVYGYRFPVTLQDPFDMSHILMRSINRSNLKIWVANCQLTFDHLTKL